jgi:hypothetical protein
MTDQKILETAMDNLPKDIKNNINKIYKERTEQLLKYLRKESLDKDAKKQIIESVVRTYGKKFETTNEAVENLINIYKKRDLLEIGLAGLDVKFEYKNPDPEDFILNNNYDDVAKMVKGIMDNGNDKLELYVPSKTMYDTKTWGPSFKYWQLYANLVGQLMQNTVNLDMLQSAKTLENKYKTRPFLPEKKQNQQQQKKGDQKKKGKQKGGYPNDRRRYDRRDDRWNDRRRDDRRGESEHSSRRPSGLNDRRDDRRRDDRRGEEKKDFMRIGDGKRLQQSDLNSIMQKIRVEIEDRNLSLWNHARFSLKEGYKFMVENTENIEDEVIMTPQKKVIKFKDPLTGYIYDEEDLRGLNTKTEKDKFIKKLKDKVFKRIKVSDTNITLDDIPNITEYKPYLNLNISLNDIPPSFWRTDGNGNKGLDFGKKDIDKKIKKFLNDEMIEKRAFINTIGENYTLNVVNYLYRLKEDVNTFKKLRERILLTLIGYYGHSHASIGQFLDRLKDRFEISNIEFAKMLGKKVDEKNKNKVTQVVNDKESIIQQFGNKEKEILKKVDIIIGKTLPDSKQRSEMLKKREMIINLLVDRKKKEIDELRKKRERIESNRKRQEAERKRQNTNKRREINQEMNEEKEINQEIEKNIYSRNRKPVNKRFNRRPNKQVNRRNKRRND